MAEIMRFRGEYAFLSNLYETKVVWDGRVYSCSEAAFQSAKTLDEEERSRFCMMNGKRAKSAGKRVTLRSDWEQVKLGVMEEVLRAKFTQNEALMHKLLATGDMQLVEGNTWGDKFWGVSTKTGLGENHLGRILMKLREEVSGIAAPAAVQPAEEERAEQLQRLKELESARGALPVNDFTGQVCGTKAFGRITILEQKGDFLTFEAKGRQRMFKLPECVSQGFLIPDDASLIEEYCRREAMEKEIGSLKKLLKLV